MKKTLFTLFICACMAVSTTAIAKKKSKSATIYGNVHLSINWWDDAAAGFTGSHPVTPDPNMTSNTSAIGLKGSTKLGGGNKMLYKLEWQVDTANRASGSASNSLTDRDQWLAWKAGWGTLKGGTMSNNYKQMGGKVDAMYRTRLEGRGILNMQSGAHGGAGVNGGRSSQTLQFIMPSMSGLHMVLNRTFTGGTGQATDETFGFGLRYKRKKWMAFFDTISMVCGAGGIATCPVAAGATDRGWKVGGNFKISRFILSGQYEDVSDIKNAGANTVILDINGIPGVATSDAGKYVFVQGVYKVNRFNKFVLSYGMESDVSKSFAFLYDHKFDKTANGYVGYGQREDEKHKFTDPAFDSIIGPANEQTIFTVGMKKKF